MLTVYDDAPIKGSLPSRETLLIKQAMAMGSVFDRMEAQPMQQAKLISPTKPYRADKKRLKGLRP